ncbi:MAG TPA: winged helix-turn-helix domain-containing tetratricopeptide repeat protein [Alphaproteobacteria bacterium]|nr:winged helix-turn-helix domain-containing tetratricopeptide repeat protein [Alphaproteobacteria bacterium]
MIYRFDEWELDTELYELRHDGRPSKVEPRVFDLLHFLVRNAGRVVSRDEIVEEIWGGRIVSEATISTCLKAARQAVGDDGRTQRFIKTVHGRGFRVVGAVSSGDEAASNGPSYQDADVTPHEAVSAASSPPGLKAGAPPTSGRPTLAVLPFDNLSAEVDEYFADGLTEDIITNLSRFRELLVIARTASFQFKGRAVGLAQLTGELGANYVVEGSVRRAGGRVRITAQLIDAASGVHLWADHYDREMEDIFAVQDEVTRTIAATLGVKLQDVALTRSLKKSPAELDAYDCLLHARRYTSLLSTEMHAEARDLLEKAVALDQSSAEAHALLANVYLAEHRFDANPRPDPIGRALKMAQIATRLDPQDAYAHCWLAIVHFFRGENDKFEVEAQRALALNPNDPETIADIGHYLAFMGEFDRGIELSRRAQQLNPLHPGWYYFSFARYHYDQREYDKVLADIERISLPDFYWCGLLRTAALGQLGRDEAGASLAQIITLKPDFSAYAELQKWNAAPRDMEHILEGLRKAGLDE